MLILLPKRTGLLAMFLLCSAFLTNVLAYDKIVAKDGSGDYTTVQAAIDAAPTGLTAAYTIYIKNGKYKEKITVPSNKPFIQLIGESVANVVLYYDDYASKMLTCNSTVGTQNSASFTVNANDFAAFNITFANTFGDGSQGVAVLVNADRSVFKNCRFLANQDTVYLKGSGTPKAYFKNCYIDGNVDFIFGSSIALFDSCVVYAKTRPATSASYITAPNTPLGQAYGFVFKDARLPMNVGNTLYYLSRPWPSPDVANTRQKTVFISSVLSSHIQPTGWSTWDANTVTANLYYGEYSSKYFNGSLADISQRVAWSYQLSTPEASTYTIANMFGAWDPCAVATDVCNAIPTDIAVSNFRGTKNVSSSVFDWNISWPMTGIQYELFRSSDNVSFSSVYSTTALNDTAINFNYTDNTVPASGSIYYYYLKASKTGYASHNTDTLQISNAPQIVVNASAALSLCGFNQAIGTPSAAQTYTVSASNLTGNLTITPPVNYEVSADNSTWFTNASPLSITPASGTVAPTTIYIRLNAVGAGSYGGNITNASAPATTINVPVTGNTVAAPTSFLLQQWNLTSNTDDDATVRSNGVTASSSTLNNLYTSDGSTPPITAYSTTYGQAFGSSATGNNWSLVGGTLKRGYYQQFTVTASAGNSVRIDSIAFLSDFYLTNSNTKMSVVYSKNGFGSPADSTEFTNGVTGAGTSLVLAASGTFTKSFPILRNDGGAINYYSVSLNGTTGVSLNAGETITIRLYWACGSTGTPRFAYLKNVKVMGLVTTALPIDLLSFTGGYENKKLMLNWKTTNEQNADHFEIERSSDGRNFSLIASKISEKNAINNYAVEDKQPLNSIAYYRLKMIDKDGSFKYSTIVIIKSSFTAQVKITPNPAHDFIQIKLPVAGKYEIIISDNTGKKIQQFASTQKELLLPVSSFSRGIYYISINNGTDKTIEKIMLY